VIVIFHSHHVDCEGGDLVSLLGRGARRIRGDWSKLWGGMVVGVAAKCISVDLTRWQLGGPLQGSGSNSHLPTF
jgi:hypothetical protein